jgi:hypothetical protein
LERGLAIEVHLAVDHSAKYDATGRLMLGKHLVRSKRTRVEFNCRQRQVRGPPSVILVDKAQEVWVHFPQWYSRPTRRRGVEPYRRHAIQGIA